MKLASGGMGATLNMLLHIHSVSVHPVLEERPEAKDFFAASGRLSATFDILRRLRGKRERALIFTESRQMQYRFIELAKTEFGLTRRFQHHLENDAGFDLLVLGPEAAGTALPLPAATHTVHLSRWWNPAVEEQCNDRVHRLGQSRPVTVHVPLAIHPAYRELSFDLLLQSLMQRKRRLASAALWPMGDDEGDLSQLQNLLQQSATTVSGKMIGSSMEALFKRDGIEISEPDGVGAWSYK